MSKTNKNIKTFENIAKNISKTVNNNSKNTNTKRKSTTNKNENNSNNSKRSKPKTSKIKFSIARLVVFIIITALTLSFGLIFKDPIENMLNKKSYTSTSNSGAEIVDENGLSVHFIDVGQGDAIAIRFPDQKTMLVDAGPESGKNNLINYLKNKFFNTDENKFDYLLLTHSDEDHCGSMKAVCDEFVIDKIYRPYIYCVKYDIDETKDAGSGSKYTKDTYVYYKTIKAFKNEIASNGEKAKMVMTDMDELNTVGNENRIETTLYSIDFYAPTEKYVTKHGDSIPNDYSPIMVLNYNGKKIMLTGDASEVSEDLAMKKSVLPDVDVLKVGHHGSATSSSTEFLAQIKPEIAVICVGVNNKYNHPTTATLNRLQEVGAEVFRTDINGNIVINIASNSGAELNIFSVVGNEAFYIHVEYLMAGIVLLSITLCFGIKIKS